MLSEGLPKTQPAASQGSTENPSRILWLVFRVLLFGVGVFSATLIAQLIDPRLTWVPLEGAHWFVALAWGLLIGIWSTAPLSLASPAHRRDAYRRFRSLGWRRLLARITFGVLAGLVAGAAIAAAVTSWYEAFPSRVKLLALAVNFPVFFAPFAGIEIWLHTVLPAGLALSDRAERGVVALLLLVAPYLFLDAGLQRWPAVAHIPYYLTACQFVVALPLLASALFHARPFAGAAALTIVASWTATIVCPLY